MATQLLLVFVLLVLSSSQRPLVFEHIQAQVAGLQVFLQFPDRIAKFEILPCKQPPFEEKKNTGFRMSRFKSLFFGEKTFRFNWEKSQTKLLFFIQMTTQQPKQSTHTILVDYKLNVFSTHDIVYIYNEPCLS